MKANSKQIGGNHYKSGIDVWDFVHQNDIGYLAGNAIKYLARFKKKNGVEDLLKSQHYIEKLIEVETEAEEERQAQAEISLARSRDGV